MDLEKYNIVLASQSPRRSELLKALDIDFTVRVIETDESFPATLPSAEVAEYIAIKKAEAHSNSISNNELIITADTVVVHNEIIYGKPKSKKEAVDTLLILSDQIHIVYTGVCLMFDGIKKSFSCKSEVKFAPITEAEASFYYDKYKPDDKAGSYGIQDWMGMAKVEWMKGSYNNIVGLPTADLYTELTKLFK
ncbi:Maf family nucleotide pyrophosphatase [Saprospiraceae bacterium]|nr:Maf family nucleotide pyrophosphatase [Saprospiraceae bacterium]